MRRISTLRAFMPRLLVLAGLALGFAVLAGGCRGWTSDQPPIHLNPNMDTQKNYKPYRKSDFFADGRAMRMPIDGTVPRTLAGNEQRDADFLQLDDHFYTGKAMTKDGEGNPAETFALGFPKDFAVDDKTLERGRERYNIFCAPCHAQDGSGKGTVATRLPVPPPTFHQGRINVLPLGSIYDTITHGKNWPNMPAYAQQIPPSDRWAIVAYVRALMKTQNPKINLVPSEDDLPPDPASLAGDPVAMGEALYQTKGCNACHSLDGSRRVGPSFKGIWGRTAKNDKGADYTVDEAYLKQSMLEPNAVVVATYLPNLMPAQNLTDDEVNAIIEYMKTLK